MTSLKKNKTIINLYSVTNKVDDSFVGIKIKNDLVEVYHPECYEINDNTFKDDILCFLNTISIAKTNSSNIDKTSSKNAAVKSFALLSYLWIIQDYIANGIYINKEKEYKENSAGRINWKRTIKTEPIISNGNIIYTNIIFESKNKVDNIIVDIHKYTLKISLEFIGWLFGISPKIIKAKMVSEAQKKIYINIIKKEISKTFDDYKKTRFKHILNVLTGLEKDKKNNEFVYGVDSYNYIFEKLIDSIFSNKNDDMNYNPSSYWNLKKDGFRKIKSSELRPDSILFDENENILYVIDSKYYRFGFTTDSKDLPETTSIQKQITYGEYLEKNTKKEINEVRNVFILPYNMKNNLLSLSKKIEYIGYAESDWKENKNHHEVIYTFLIDLKYVIKSYNKYYHEEDIKELIKQIEENKIIKYYNKK